MTVQENFGPGAQRGFLGGLVAMNFGLDPNGKVIVYQWGVSGTGRVLPDEAAERRVRHVLRWYYIILFALPFGGFIFNERYFPLAMLGQGMPSSQVEASLDL
jgi:hypothetical protein